jgi:hypothetical protein
VISAVVLELISSRCTSGRVKKLREENREGGYPVAYLYNDKFFIQKNCDFIMREQIRVFQKANLKNKKIQDKTTLKRKKPRNNFRR